MYRFKASTDEALLKLMSGTKDTSVAIIVTDILSDNKAVTVAYKQPGFYSNYTKSVCH